MEESATPSQGSSAAPTAPTDEEERKAAVLIQKTFRGHRTRHQVRGFGLDASTRWYDAVKSARYRQVTTPRPPEHNHNHDHDHEQEENRLNDPISPARRKWRMAAEIARQAGADDTSPSVSDFSSDDAGDSKPGSGATDGSSKPALDREAIKRRRAEATEARKRTAKMMDLQYFLEMVDQKHRYGSNLRKYHSYWKTADTDENFFYWLDYGGGKDIEVPECSRARLNKEQVRYLSREERLDYLVKIDKDGRLIWAKNGERVWTKDALYKDSVNGIVSITDPSPQFKYNVPPPDTDDELTSSSSEDSEEESDNDSADNTAGDEGERYVNEDFHRARGIAKMKHVSAAVLFNHMIRTSLKKGHKWIFVADTSFRLYIGYKQSGSFQHSSFLHGARILSAGLIKVKDGQLRKLSPLSGHYRPPAANFRAFVHALRDEGVDMSRVSISRSYAVLVGLESYVHTRRRVKHTEKMAIRKKDELLHPEKVQQEEEASRDKSKSAEKERVFLEQQRLAKEQEELERKESHRRSGIFSRALQKMKTRRKSDKIEDSAITAEPKEKRIMGTGPEDGIPAPEGQR
ncbi:hypothetical protein PV10_06947 [Exophiala mesophila]|uniref:IQ domain-containing protein IQM6 n=1 Tax=Exophiala mesophila TaxID=212818 RepID=A0A0D1Z481_EXOME|nr:uncharacterized protein PV10_06947 [Exophiala mesophila]KIV89557.1 hypothetical protein PV10_06947 [Exophiala mesophila]